MAKETKETGISESSLQLKEKIAKRNVKLVKVFVKTVSKFGFEVITKEVLEYNAKRWNWVPPDAVRITETEEQLSLEKWVENYRIVIYTSFNPKLGLKGEFATKGGRGWVIITDMNDKKVYVSSFKRGFKDRFLKHMADRAEFLVCVLRKRPIVPLGSRLMIIKQTYTETYWLSPLDKSIRVPITNGKIPRRLLHHWHVFDYRNKYYQKNRLSYGVTYRAHKRRKKWKVRKNTIKK